MEAMPFLRRIITACSRSPLASVSACLQSIIGAPVFSRRSLTCAADIFTVVVPIILKPSYAMKPASVAGTQNLTRAEAAHAGRMFGLLCRPYGTLPNYLGRYPGLPSWALLLRPLRGWLAARKSFPTRGYQFSAAQPSEGLSADC